MARIPFYFLLLTLISACKREKKLFQLLDPQKCGVDFNNTLTEYDSLNILNSEYVYNGGGVGIGDLNGDGLQDLFFTGNQVENRLYLNKGNLHFQDISAAAGIRKQYPDQWSSGVNLVDLNADGRLDIYVCNTFVKDPEKRRNQLYVNTGNDASGIPKFEEKARAYGVDDTTHSSNAQFFDYDLDGDLDLFIAVNFMDRLDPNRYVAKVVDGSSVNRDRLLRNDWNEALGHPVFTDVSREAGILLEGYSHSTLISDFNGDGQPDIYVANDYVTNDLAYINKGDGTFRNEIAGMFKHQAASAMGSDVADIDNDGRLDYFTTEMLPYYNKRKKLFLNGINYATYLNNDKYGYEYQYTRNTLQWNRGIDPETGLPLFSDVAFLSGVQETEWSWAPLLADFDNDGLRDLFVTNGFPRDVTDHDFAVYRSTVSFVASPMMLQEMIPQIKVPKFVFKNGGNLQFVDHSKQWGVDFPAFSNGAAYGDLDNDGDLDLVVNNIDDPAFVFKNTLNDGKVKPNYLRVKLEGSNAAVAPFGAEATLFFGGGQQKAQLVSARGYLSVSENVFHFGLGNASKADSLLIRWPGGATQKIVELPVNQTVVIRYEAQPASGQAPENPLFEILNPATIGLDALHREIDYVDFNNQRTLPHKFSQYGPALAAGDANGDGLDDLYMGGSAGHDGIWLLQTPQGRFVKKAVAYKTDPQKREEELGALLFDADSDGDQDLYLVRGGAQYEVGSPLYQDVLCVNDGLGNFSIAPNALPAETDCGQAVKVADFDGDGDLDLFVGGRVKPGTYPKTDRSFLLRNDSKIKNQPVFTDVTAQFCPELADAGMISDVLWTDFNNDNRPDLLLAGGWAPLMFFENQGNHFENVTEKTGVADKNGWWSSLAGADFDADGDIDYLAGNAGRNLYFQCSGAEPMTLYAKDFDNNGTYDPFIACYWQDSLGQRKPYFYNTRDDLVKQLLLIRRKYNSYGELGVVPADQMFTAEELKGAQILKTNWLSSSYLENKGDGRFELSALPVEAQQAPLFGMLPYDFDADGVLDVLLVGNDYGMELLQGRADAFYGLALRNRGDGRFEAVKLEKSRFIVPGDARALTRLRGAAGRELIVASQNNAVLRVFSPMAGPNRFVALQAGEVKARIRQKDGRSRMQEFYWGGSFLSQEPRNIALGAGVLGVELLDGKGRVVRRVE